jgi:DNA-binding transcriptional ArsR family regulator
MPMTRRSGNNPSSGRFAYEGLERVIHERARLSILSSLIAYKRGLPFASLKHMCTLSDGNLSRHLQVLQEAKLIEVSKSFEKNRPQTRCALTALGRRRYLEYVEVLEQVVRDAAAATGAAAKGLQGRLAPA